jgi:hypothetical protein
MRVTLTQEEIAQLTGLHGNSFATADGNDGPKFNMAEHTRCGIFLPYQSRIAKDQVLRSEVALFAVGGAQVGFWLSNVSGNGKGDPRRLTPL